MQQEGRTHTRPDQRLRPWSARYHRGARSGPLRGLTFAAKDLFDVAGYPTAVATTTERAPTPYRHPRLGRRASATLIGKTITDEVSLGILGENAFDGTPPNTKAPDRNYERTVNGMSPSVTSAPDINLTAQWSL